jgi:hypothetical protein
MMHSSVTPQEREREKERETGDHRPTHGYVIDLYHIPCSTSTDIGKGHLDALQTDAMEIALQQAHLQRCITIRPIIAP